MYLCCLYNKKANIERDIAVTFNQHNLLLSMCNFVRFSYENTWIGVNAWLLQQVLLKNQVIVSCKNDKSLVPGK